MLKKGLFASLIFFVCGCAGTMRVAEDDNKASTTPHKNIIVKPNK